MILGVAIVLTALFLIGAEMMYDFIGRRRK